MRCVLQCPRSRQPAAADAPLRLYWWTPTALAGASVAGVQLPSTILPYGPCATELLAALLPARLKGRRHRPHERARRFRPSRSGCAGSGNRERLSDGLRERARNVLEAEDTEPEGAFE